MPLPTTRGYRHQPFSMLNEKSKNPGIVTIKKLCDGLEISLREFFDDNLFDELEQEIR